MADFINTVDVIGDEVLTTSIIDRSITEHKDNSIASIGSNAFNSCTALTSVDFPAATSIGSSAFNQCYQLTSVDFPAATSIGENAFRGCSQLTSVDFSVATSIDMNAFNSCTALTSVDFPVATSMASGVFYNCSKLTTLILRNTAQVVTLSNKNAFSSTPIASGTGYIYVPRDLVNSYKSATNWSTYANQFRALEDYTVDGTTTGELDHTKI